MAGRSESIEAVTRYDNPSIEQRRASVLSETIQKSDHPASSLLRRELHTYLDSRILRIDRCLVHLRNKSPRTLSSSKQKLSRMLFWSILLSSFIKRLSGAPSLIKAPVVPVSRHQRSHKVSGLWSVSTKSLIAIAIFLSPEIRKALQDVRKSKRAWS